MNSWTNLSRPTSFCTRSGPSSTENPSEPPGGRRPFRTPEKEEPAPFSAGDRRVLDPTPVLPGREDRTNEGGSSLPLTRPVLLVDDDASANRALSAVLIRSGFPTLSTEIPGQALSLIEKHDPCLVLLDIDMPEMDGLTLLGRIRAQGGLPVVMLTGLDSSEHAVRALRLGAFDYLIKPVENGKLLRIIKLAIATGCGPKDAQTVGHYELRRELGHGGMGIVYEAYDPTLDRLVALKLLQPEFATDADFELQFLAEARAAARVSHPGLVAVYEAGRHRGRLFMAMELVRGMTLSSALALAPRDALRLVERVAEALGAAHDAGLVHRDVKPSNIMVTPQQEVKVLDFGLVRFAKEPTGWSNYAVGTPSYASPEALLGCLVDSRSDIYSLGVVLYELLAGCRAFTGSSFDDVRAKVISGRLTGPELIHVPAPWRELVEWMMSTNPARRPESMATVASKIRRLIEASRDPRAAAPIP